jgi:hypothetical protein
MPKNITVDGVKYQVTEQPSYDCSIGCSRAFVETPDGEKAVVKQGRWRFWTPRDRTAPLREAVAHGWLKPKHT